MIIASLLVKIKEVFMNTSADNLTVLSTPVAEKGVAFNQSVDSLTETMSELFLLAKMTGRKGLPQRVVLSIVDVLLNASRLAEVQK